MNKIFGYFNLNQIPYKKIIYRLGYPSVDKLNEKEKKIINTLIENIVEIWSPKGILKEDKVLEIKNDSVICKKIKIPGKDIASHLKGCKKVTFMAVTTGKEAVDYRDHFIKENKMTKATISDAILSEFADKLADELNKLVQREADLQGYTLTTRFSPGYGDLSLNFQEKLLNFLGVKEIGIELNENYLMIPEKSVTAMVGWKEK